ncbi:MAG: hypothetical protein JXR22_07800 [Prolixibacteraceae bacterium]|nr:hypothetical protein [Prolixibacteraceae bacterium]
MRRRFFLFIFPILINLNVLAQKTHLIYLSGKDKDHTVEWDFYCDKGRKSGEWQKIDVPSQWELQGFGTYNYGYANPKADEIGTYKTTFELSTDHKGQCIKLVFEGVMTDTKVKVNGKLAGPIHQGGFYRFQYDISSLVSFSKPNQLEVEVAKVSANASVNRAELDADYWIFGGIYRPVYLKITPKTHIERVAIDAKANGSFTMDVYTENARTDDEVIAQVTTLEGQKVGEPFFSKVVSANNEKISLQTEIFQPLTWNAEFPNLYYVELAVLRKGELLHSHVERFGFRTIEIRKGDGVYVNGQRIMLKGVNRHSHWPESGRTLSREIHLTDIELIKQMNMNAVRMSHYPPDVEFLDLCDSLGLYVLDELAGWQASYDTEVGRKLVKATVTRDVNHPSILFWDNGNEGGWNLELDNEYALYDPQKRTVLHPWESFNNINTKHYIDYNYLVNAALYSNEIVMPTEFLHGLYDGGHGAGLDDYWNIMLAHPSAAGGFLWVLTDEGIVRTDQENRIDANKNYYPDGILGPHREKEASFYTIKEVWSPIFIHPKKIGHDYPVELTVENRYSFTNLSQCTFKWSLVKFPAPADENPLMNALAEGLVAPFDLLPNCTGQLRLELPSEFQKADALYLTAFAPDQSEIMTWDFPLKSPGEMDYLLNLSVSEGALKVSERSGSLSVLSGETEFVFDTLSGFLSQISNGGTELSLSNGPALAGIEMNLTGFKHSGDAKKYKVEANYKGNDAWFNVYWTFEPGIPARIDYAYSQGGTFNFMGLTFSYPEEKIKSMTWVGEGPYRVWKNRLKGNTLGLWEKDANNSVTGETWQYPEFRGYHANLYWAKLLTDEGVMTIISSTGNDFLQLLKPQKPLHAGNEHNSPPFPEGTIGLMKAIPPIGTKFKQASQLGPQSQANSRFNAYEKGTFYLELKTNLKE